MSDEYQEIANEIGEALRAAEAEADAENATGTRAALTTLHEKLGQGFLAFNALADAEGFEQLDWDQVAGNAQARGGVPKSPPEPQG